MVHAQKAVDFSQFPFEIGSLENLSYHKDDIMPTFIDGKFYYVDLKTGKKITDKGFDVAYPFKGRVSTIVKSGNKFGVIDRSGKLLVEPVYNGFSLWDTFMRENFACFYTGKEKFVVFDLASGNYVTPGNGCGEPGVAHTDFWSFIGDNNKYGIKKVINNDYDNPKEIIPPIFDSVYLITSNLIIVMKNNKIGVIDEHNKNILPFEYDNIILSSCDESSFPEIMGLFKNANWEYYDINRERPKLILKSEHKCSSMGEINIKTGFGIFEKDGKYNILFTDGSVMKKEYDWISAQGNIAIDNNEVYIIAQDGIPFLYYKK